MGPWLGVVQWAEVILHWQGPKSNDLCISWTSQDETLTIVQIQQGMGKNKLQVMS